MSLRSRLDRLSRELCWGGLWDGATLEDFRAALQAKRSGLPYAPSPDLWRAAVFMRILRNVIDLDPAADSEAAKDRMMQQGRDAGFSAPELARLQAELTRRLGRSSCVT
jgi:hypothetical protein